MQVTRAQLSEWFDQGVAQGAAHMLVITDTFDYSTFPVYTQTDEECMEKYNAPGQMQKVMEVYDLTAYKIDQLTEERCFRLPNHSVINSIS